MSQLLTALNEKKHPALQGRLQSQLVRSDEYPSTQIFPVGD